MNLPLANPTLFHEAWTADVLNHEPQMAGFGPTYGNRLATARMLRDRWLEDAGLIPLSACNEAGATLTSSRISAP